MVGEDIVALDSETETEALPYATSITKAEINELPLYRYEGMIHLINTDEDARRAVKILKKEPVLGFDTESRPSFRKGDHYLPSLVQFASATEVYLFQIGQFDGMEAIKPLLSSKSIAKVGVALHDDVKRLQEITPYKDRNFVEIATMTKQLEITNTGLRSLAAILLGFRISKGAQVSNWARQNLSRSQLTYAATDAWVSRLLYEKAAALVDDSQ
ncbi:3'-5' exonuclease [Ruficoccus sp. ZRK36]|uniref:3'-5' exonuclease n=1 Tax=Ruficoccus sp. ZRK36 TaxID=2866311 RepID=UPI001C739A99|nr:3'-5' exonuclease [Ruficoccus sp. ZRK36]QYY36896.1 3'-5' exonuclease domain-containing protein 2 [Ruficoccus sp. ZRK36]